MIKPPCMTEFEQILLCKLLMQAFPHRTKSALIVGVSRQTITYALDKWAPMWAAHGSYLSTLPMHHKCCEKELPEEQRENKLNKISHLFDGNDAIIETPRKNDNFKRRVRSEKVHKSAARTINFSTPMGLSFEHTRAEGAQASEEKIVKWWGSAEQYAFDLKPFKNQFQNKEPTPPKPYWVASNKKTSLVASKCASLHLTEDEIVESIFNNADDLILNENICISNSDFFSGNGKDQTCSEIDHWFDQLLHHQMKRNLENGDTSSNAQQQLEKLNTDLKQANESTPQHDLNELRNQLLCREQLNLICERDELKKCILSAYLA